MGAKGEDLAPREAGVLFLPRPHKRPGPRKLRALPSFPGLGPRSAQRPSWRCSEACRGPSMGTQLMNFSPWVITNHLCKKPAPPTLESRALSYGTDVGSKELLSAQHPERPPGPTELSHTALNTETQAVSTYLM